MCREEGGRAGEKGERKENAKTTKKKNLIPTGAVMKIHTEATCPFSSKFSDSLQEFVQVSRWASGED